MMTSVGDTQGSAELKLVVGQVITLSSIIIVHIYT